VRGDRSGNRDGWYVFQFSTTEIGNVPFPVFPIPHFPFVLLLRDKKLGNARLFLDGVRTDKRVDALQKRLHSPVCFLRLLNLHFDSPLSFILDVG